MSQELPPALPGEGPAPVGEGITDAVVGDAVPVIRGQQVPPIAVAVGVGGDNRVGGLAVLVVVLGFGGDVAVSLGVFISL